eukprot:3139988-Amphidinium_carterae.1
MAKQALFYGKSSKLAREIQIALFLLLHSICYLLGRDAYNLQTCTFPSSTHKVHAMRDATQVMTTNSSGDNNMSNLVPLLGTSSDTEVHGQT